MATLFDFSRGVTKEVIAADQTIVSNTPVRVGGLMGVAMTNAILGDDGNYWVTVAFTGVLSSVGVTDIASGAIDQGDAIYTSTAADASGHAVAVVLDTVDTGDLFGYALNTRVAVDGNLEIKVVN